MSISVVPFSGQPEQWDEFVQSARGMSHFHLFGWKTVIERTFGHECHYLEAREAGGDLIGVLPLVRVRSLVFGDYLVSMPFLNYGGPLGTRRAVRALADRAEGLARDGGVDLLELRCRHPLRSISLAVSRRKITVVRDLHPGNPEALWKDLKSKVRSQVRRPRKEGVEVRFGPSQVEPFYRVFSEHMRDLGTPALPRAFFGNIAEVFGEDVWFGCAYLDDKPVASGCGFRWSDEFEITWASALREHSRIAANMLLYWEFMERSCEEGLARFNFGRCSPGSGTHRFKSQWGGRDEQLSWYQWSADGETDATPAPDQGVYAAASRIWSRLPLPVARVFGPRIVKYIP